MASGRRTQVVLGRFVPEGPAVTEMRRIGDRAANRRRHAKNRDCRLVYLHHRDRLLRIAILRMAMLQMAALQRAGRFTEEKSEHGQGGEAGCGFRLGCARQIKTEKLKIYGRSQKKTLEEPHAYAPCLQQRAQTPATQRLPAV